MFGVIHMDGSGEDDPAIESLSDLYDELVTTGIIDGNVAVINDDLHWSMSAHRDGRLVFERLGASEVNARHMIPVSKERVLMLWKRLINGDIDGLLAQTWKPGYSDR